ncbi:glycosyltransferase [Mangrovimonas sp. CR14]|uniref:ArnT family glycosyltransferase n=1 Tax=Mangrovimonas sp. CR14 TaxID=2706120 RepID=UPI00141DBE0D|nr:glycosyltransferase family 39 protein [Mangrovimonas sp. CR14]NIK92492.1 glycosyltransferase [Mangrovimonas sp. CR14]
MTDFLKKHPVLTICLFTAVMLLPNLHVMDVTIMEARNFISAREMIQDGHWLLTTMNGEARYQKPPMPTWITAVSGSLFGISSVYALRLPTVFFVMLIGIFIYKLSLLLVKNKSHSLRNGLIGVTSFYVIGITMEAPWDIYTHGFMIAGIYFLIKIFSFNDLKIKWIALATLFLGLSFLCKGPVSYYALMLPFLIAYGFTYKYQWSGKLVFTFIGILILSLVIGGWWFIYVRQADPATFESIATKETSNWGSYNVRPFYYYWSFFVQSGLWTIPAFISLLYPYLKSRVSHLKAYQFSLLWTLFAVVLLSIIPEKKSRYLMPVLIPLAINIGFYIQYLITHFKELNNKKETVPVYFNFGLIGLIGLAFPILGYILLKGHFHSYWISYLLASLVLFGLGLMIYVFLIKKNMKMVFYLTVTFFAGILVTALPLSKATTTENFKPIWNLKNQLEAQNLKLYGNNVSPEVFWHYGTTIPFADLNNMPNEEEFGFITGTLSASSMKKLLEQYTIEEKMVFDMNRVEVSSSRHNDRLQNEYYLLKRKP